MSMKYTLIIITLLLLISCNKSFSNKDSKVYKKNELARQLVEENKLDSAILIYHEAIAIAPNYGDSYWWLLAAYCKMDVKDSILKGINLVHKFNKLDKDSMSNLMVLGFHYYRIGMEAEANRCYNQYVDNVKVPKSDINYYFNQLMIGADKEKIIKLFKENIDSTANYENYKMYYDMFVDFDRKIAAETLLGK